jgi:hypothetical protein
MAPWLRTDRIEPTDPMDRIEPAEPIDKIEPAEPMERIEPADAALRIDPKLANESIEATERAERSDTIDPRGLSSSTP